MHARHQQAAFSCGDCTVDGCPVKDGEGRAVDCPEPEGGIFRGWRLASVSAFFFLLPILLAVSAGGLVPGDQTAKFFASVAAFVAGMGLTLFAGRFMKTSTASNQ